MSPILQLMTLASLLTVADCLPTHNITVPAPEGFFNHGQNNLFCVPIKWYNILIFFFTNYIAHAATVKSRPGQKFRHAARDFLLALAFPYSGLLRSLSAISEFSRSKLALKRAYYAGALWIVEEYDFECEAEGLAADSQALREFLRPDQLSTPQVKEGNQKGMSPNGQQPQDESQIREAIPLQNMKVGQGSRDGEDKSTHEHHESASKILQSGTTGEADDRASSSPPKVSTLASNNDSTAWARLGSKILSMLENPDPKPRNVHGVCTLPDGYRIAPLEFASRIYTEKGQLPGDMELCTSYNMPKAILAVLQTFFASITLYRSRGDQISLYGYTSFGLTIIPYIIMSIMNFCAGVVLPEYPTVFIVLSEASDEAVARGGRIEGAVGRLGSEIDPKSGSDLRDPESEENAPFESGSLENGRQEPTPRTAAAQAGDHSEGGNILQNTGFSQENSIGWVDVKPHAWRRMGKGLAIPIVTFIFGAIPIAVIGGLTHFKAGHSTAAQRVWTMMWLVFGIICGPYFELFSWQGLKEVWFGESGPLKYFVNIFICAGIFGVPAIGGFVVVGQMLKAYGSCTLLS